LLRIDKKRRERKIADKRGREAANIGNFGNKIVQNGKTLVKPAKKRCKKDKNITKKILKLH